MPKLRWAILVVAVAFVGWGAVVIASGFGLNPSGVDWSFERTGQLGDSFGVLSSAMAALAALFTYDTLRETRSENDRLRKREEARDDTDRKRDVEATFFKMLSVRAEILNSIEYRVLNNIPFKGSDAIDAMLRGVRRRMEGNEIGAREAYEFIFNSNKNDLGHYFRFTYHIIKFLDDNLEKFEESYSYVRMLRAQLANSEIVMIALNCTYGAGIGPFHHFVYKFSLLHNLGEDDIDAWNLRAHFRAGAFGAR